MRLEVGTRRGLPVDLTELQATIEAAKRLPSTTPEEKLARNHLLATLHLFAGRWEEAEKTWKSITQEHPDFVPAWCRQAEFEEASDNPSVRAKAKESWTHGLELEPKHPLVRDRTRLGIDVEAVEKGVRLVKVERYSPAEEVGWGTGDIITQTGNTPLDRLPTLERFRRVRLFGGGMFAGLTRLAKLTRKMSLFCSSIDPPRNEIRPTSNLNDRRPASNKFSFMLKRNSSRSGNMGCRGRPPRQPRPFGRKHPDRNSLGFPVLGLGEIPMANHPFRSLSTWVIILCLGAVSHAGDLGRTPVFELKDVAGKVWTNQVFADHRATAVIFLGTGCPVANLYLPELNELATRYPATDLQVIGVNANAGDSLEAIAKHASEFQIKFPVLLDPEQKLADGLSAVRTPEAILIDQKGVIRYRGRIDDRHGYTFRRDSSTRADLEEAIREVLAGKEVSVAKTEPLGCLLHRRAEEVASADVTFASQVSRIINNKCGYCHRAGAAAPFALETYEDVSKWADAIKEVVNEQRMPPWHATAPFGHFSNDRRLTDNEKTLLVRWIDEGRAKGNDQDLPPAVKREETGWMIGKPDVVFKMPQKVDIQANGVVAYQYYITPTNFKEDVWVTAAEAKPGNRAVVHHIILFFRDPKVKVPIGEPDGKKFGFLVAPRQAICR